MFRFLIIFIFVVCIAGISQATIIAVPSEQPTIQAGVDAAAEGDTVLVADGTYLQNVDVIGKNIVLGSEFLYSNDTTDILNTIITPTFRSSIKSAIIGFAFKDCDSSTILTGFTIDGFGSAIGLFQDRNYLSFGKSRTFHKTS